MDFFTHQEQAQSRTYILFFWFACAVLAVIFAVYAAVTVGLFAGQLFLGDSFQYQSQLHSQEQWFQVHVFWNVSRFFWVSGISFILIAVMLPALKTMSVLQYQVFVKNIRLLIQANHRINLFEYMLQRLLLRHLKASFSSVKIHRVKYHKIQALSAECGCVLAILISYGSHTEAESLFKSVSNDLLGELMPWPPLRVLQLSRLNEALNKLECAAPSVKKALLAASMQVVLADGLLHVKELEALRAIADGMDCPVPMI